MATISSQTNRRLTTYLVMSAVDLREVSLTQKVREFKDIVLDLLVDWPLRGRLLLFYHYVYK